jgi:hypothetical protein
MPQLCPVPVVPSYLVRPRRGLVALLVGVTLSLGLAHGVLAATTWTVCASGCDYSSIKAAIAASTTLDGDTLAIAAGTYTEAGITVNKSLTLQGEAVATTIVQAAVTLSTATDRLFTIPSGVSVTLQDLTIRHGRTTSVGGGLSNVGTLTLTQSTVHGNAATHGGGLYLGDGRLTLTASLVAKNPDGGDCWNDASSIISKGYNLDSDGSCHLTAPTDQPSTDPLLGPLQENGGPTQTHALLPGSPAIDAIPWGANGCGTTLLSDQRWQARPQPSGGRCDIGAYEVEVDGQALAGWVTGLTPSTVVCQSVTTAQVVTLSDPVSPWDCEAAGLGVTPGDRVTMHVRGRIKQRAPDIGGAVAGMIPTSGGCANLTTGQQVRFQHMVGATAASCVAAGLVVQEGEAVQMRVQGAAE